MAYSPSTDNYSLGRGVLYFNRLDPDTGLYTGERDLGNTSAFSYNVALTKLDHYSSRGGLKVKDLEIISEMTPTVTFTLDEISKENLSILTLATMTQVTVTGATVTGEDIVAHPGSRTMLAHRGISNVVIKDKATGLIIYSPTTDYHIDTTLKDDKIGRIYVPIGSTMTEGEIVTVAYTYASSTYYTIDAYANTQVTGMLRFVSDNPAGQNMELQIWSVSLTQTSEVAMIGDAFSTLGFSGEVLEDSAGHPTTPFMQFIMDYAPTV